VVGGAEQAVSREVGKTAYAPSRPALGLRATAFIPHNGHGKFRLGIDPAPTVRRLAA
jgi:hypothetical protein